MSFLAEPQHKHLRRKECTQRLQRGHRMSQQHSVADATEKGMWLSPDAGISNCMKCTYTNTSAGTKKLQQQCRCGEKTHAKCLQNVFLVQKKTKVPISGWAGSMTTAGARTRDLVSHKSQIHLGMQPEIPALERWGEHLHCLQSPPPRVCATGYHKEKRVGSKGIVRETHPSPIKIGSSFPGLSLLF